MLDVGQRDHRSTARPRRSDQRDVRLERPSQTIGTRVYVPNGNEDDVGCFDYSKDESCAEFPHAFSNLGLLYTVSADP